jgi:hypothetical protein
MKFGVWKVPFCFYVALLAFLLIQPKSASAQFSISSPEVKKGELEIEEHSSFQSGLPDDSDDAISQGHEVSVGYGITDIWKAEVAFGFQKPKGNSFEASTIEIENTIALRDFKPLGGDLAARQLANCRLESATMSPTLLSWARRFNSATATAA